MMTEMAWWESRKIGYFLDFSKEPIDSNFYLHLLEGFHVYNKDINETSSIKLKKNLYITSQAADFFQI